MQLNIVQGELGMSKNENIKDHIIEITTKLIEKYNGDTKSITARMIAEKAEIGLGLINYHFGSKENLITECVQRIIGKVVANFHMEQKPCPDKERLSIVATYVFDFLFEHSAISRISILGDFEKYTYNCNSVYAQKGFMKSIQNDISESDKNILVFALTAAMQAAFLGSETVKQLFGYDFQKSEDRALYIKKLVNILFEGAVKIDE